jgi:DNA-binding NarL/FixJ family response regulator
MSSDPIRILSVDDHAVVRQGIREVINGETDMLLVAEASTGVEGIRQFREYKPDVTLMDLRLTDISGIDVMVAIRKEFSNARIVMLTTFEGDVEVRRAIMAGARGYILKNMPPDEMLSVIRDVHAGRMRIPREVAESLAEHIGDDAITERETEILKHLANGKRNREIADLLNISEETVKVHLKRALEKLGASDRTHAIAIAIRRGVIRP